MLRHHRGHAHGRHHGRRRWSELSAAQQVLAVAIAVVQLGLLVAALSDLRRRPADDIRGPKPAWVLASFVNFVGPIAYFAVGRKRG